MSALDPADVSQRLSALGETFVAESLEEGRKRRHSGQGRRSANLEPKIVAERLAELRMLLAATEYLHSGNKL